MKVTFSNTRPEADTEAAKSKGKQRKTKRKKRITEQGEEDGEDSEIVDIQNYFQIPAGEGNKSSNRRRGHEYSDTKVLKNIDASEIEDQMVNENFRRSLQELHGRKTSGAMEGRSIGQTFAPLVPELEE